MTVTARRAHARSLAEEHQQWVIRCGRAHSPAAPTHPSATVGWLGPQPARGALGLAELMVQERAEEIVEVFFRAIRQGDWRAGAALLERVYGRPEQKVAVAHPQSVDEVEQMSLAQIRQLRAVTELDYSE